MLADSPPPDEQTRFSRLRFFLSRATALVGRGLRVPARRGGGSRASSSRGGALPKRKTARRIAQRLGALADAMAARTARTEPDFVALGSDLRGLYQNAANLSQLVSHHVGTLQQALTRSRITGADGISATSLRDLRSALDEAAQRLQSLRNVAKELENLRQTVGAIERIGVFLRTLVIGFSVESVRTENCQTAFGSFVAELRALAQRIDGLGEAVGQRVADAHGVLHVGLREMIGGVAELEKLTGQLTGTAEATAAKAQALFDDTLTRLRDIEGSTQRLTQHTSDAVVQLQFGDIVRQKSEHVIEALRTARKLVQTARSRCELRGRLAAVHRLVRIQTKQMEAIRSEIATAHGTLTGAFRAIADEARCVHEPMQTWGEAGSSRGNAETIEGLTGDLRRIAALRKEGHRLRAHAHEAARSAVDASTHLAQHIDEVEAVNLDMHLQALNAIVRTAVLGDEGATLEVLSRNADALYRDSTREVKAIVTNLETFLGHARATLPEDHAHVEESLAAENLGAELDNITLAYANLRDAAGSAAAIASAQREQLLASEARLEFLAEFSSAIGGEQDQLDALQHELAAWSRYADEADVGSLEALEVGYTMESERAIHESTADAEAVASAASSASHAGRFDAHSRAMPDGASQVPLAVTEGKSSATPTDSARDSNNDRALGDNVELF